MALDPRRDRPSRILPGSTAAVPAHRKFLNPDSPWFKGALVLGFLALLIAVLVTRFRPAHQHLTPERIGAVATEDVRATKDFSYGRVDTAATAQHRDQKAAAVPRIYRWDPSWAQDSNDRIQRTFQTMRAELDAFQKSELEALNAAAGLASGAPPSVPSNIPPISLSAEPLRLVLLSLLGVLPFSEIGGEVASRVLATHAQRRALAKSMRRVAVHGLVTGSVVDWARYVERARQAQVRRQQAQDNLQAELRRALLSLARAKRAYVSQQLGVYLESHAYEALVTNLFDESLEIDLLDLLNAINRHPIVATRISDQDAITIQKRRPDRPALEEWVHRDPSNIADLERARYRDLAEHANNLLAARPPDERQQLQDIARLLIRVNTKPDDDATRDARDAARAGVADLHVQVHFRRNDIIISSGQVITEEHVAIYRAMIGGSAEAGQLTALTEIAGLLIFLVISIGGLVILLRRDLIQRFPQQRDLVFMGATLLIMVVIVRISPAVLKAIGHSWFMYAPELTLLMIPFASGAMMTRLVLNGATALTFSLTFALLIGLVLDQTRLLIPYVLTSGIIGTIVLRAAKTRMSVLKAGFQLGLLNAASATGLVLLLEPQAFGESFLSASQIPLFGLVSGLSSGMIVMVVLPVVEQTFDYTTSIKLLELANLENPLLKELLMRAPGSYHHSMMVGSLNEAAAEAIGADTLLVRVGAYYHDIGKMKNPQYFAENQQGDNPHDKLKPQMSALILKSHVKDGIELARLHKLPAAIIDFIATHHGTSRIEYFYHRAREAEAPGMPEVSEQDYRYPGPRPQSRETGICMICDSIEAAVRSLPEKSPDRIKALVQKLIHAKFIDGQFSECNLTLADLNAIAGALFRVLTSIYHHRPEYPGSSGSRARTSPKSPPVAASSQAPNGNGNGNGKKISRPATDPTLPAVVPEDLDLSNPPIPHCPDPMPDPHQPPSQTSPHAAIEPASSPASLFRPDHH